MDLVEKREKTTPQHRGTELTEVCNSGNLRPLFTLFLCVEVFCRQNQRKPLSTNAERLCNRGQLSRGPAEINDRARIAHANGIVEDHAFVHFATGVAQVGQAGVLQLQRRVLMNKLRQPVLDQADGVRELYIEGRLGRRCSFALVPPPATAAFAWIPGKTHNMLRARGARVPQRAR